MMERMGREVLGLSVSLSVSESNNLVLSFLPILIYIIHS